MVNRKMLVVLMTLVVFSLIVGIAAAKMVIQDEAEVVLAERLREEGFDPEREDVAEAANAVLTQLREEHQDTESLIAVLRQDPYVIARISDLAADLVDPIDNDDNTEAPVDDQAPSQTESEEPVDEEDGPGNWAPRERAIQRLQEHLERGLPVENALAAVTKEEHRLRWAEQEGQDADDLDEELDDADEIEENDEDFEEVPEEPDENTDPADDTKQSKLERTEKKSKAKVKKELAKRERKLEKEKAKQEKREKKEERKKGRNQGKSNK